MKILQLVCLAGFTSVAAAQGMLDAIRKLDLNSYALSANYYISASPFDGIEDFIVAFPAPTKFDPSFDTGEAFFVRDGDFGLRKRLGNDWDLAGVLAIQGLGYGSGQSAALAGMSRRDWTVHAGVMSGRSIGDYRVDFGVKTDILGEHNGEEIEVKLARIFMSGDHYLQPQVEATWQSSEFVNHYYGVGAAEALPDRPEYRPGAAITYGASLEWGWKWHPRWYVKADASIKWLPPEIRNSPVVSKDSIGTFMLTLAYDAPSMVAAQSTRPSVFGAGIEASVGGFFATADSKIFLTDGVGILPIDLESTLTLDDKQLSVPFNILWRINEFHRLEFGYFELKRSGAGDIVLPVDIGDASFVAGATVHTGFDTRVFRLGYAFSLLHDTQKELSLFGGAHVSDVSFHGSSANDQIAADTTPILPVLGADLQLNFTDRISVRTELQFFVSDFNRYSGNLIDFGVSGWYTWRDWLTAGVGFRYYRQDIDSADGSFPGNYRFEYRGPFISITARL